MSAVGKLVIQLDDDRPCPLVGLVIGQEDEDRVWVLWGDARYAPAEHADQSMCEYADELRSVVL